LFTRTFAPSASRGQGPVWTPPIDILETPEEILILTAMPGVDTEAIEVEIEGDILTIAGRREMPSELASAHIHRLELPQGRFERRITLPPGAYRTVHRTSINNCLVIRLSKT
jgi:HSP20 family molecular chaperone IbpA